MENLKQSFLSLEAIALELILFTSLVGAAAPFAHGGRAFRWGLYLFEFASSACAGLVCFFFLKVFEIPMEWVIAACGIASYFGTKLLSVFYAVAVAKLKKSIEALPETDLTENVKGPKND